MKKSKKPNGEYKVESGVPIPPRHGGRVSKYPWDKMEPQVTRKSGKEIVKTFSFLGTKAAVSASTSWQRKHPGTKFISRREGDSFRIWRVK